jgi:hypothetical protein
LISSLVITGAAGGIFAYEAMKSGSANNQTSSSNPKSPSGIKSSSKTTDSSNSASKNQTKAGLVHTPEPSQPAVELEKPSKKELKKKLKNTDLTKEQRQHILDISEKTGGGLSTSKLKKIIKSMEDRKLREQIRNYQKKVRLKAE